MRILVVVSNYPHPGHRFSGIFNERSVDVLKHHCEFVAVLAPHPYVPNVLTSFLPVGRWEAYAEAKSFEVRNGVPVYRPPYLQLPRVAASFWQDRGAYACCVGTVRKLHARHKFDAILSFGLDGSGGLAWRLGRRFEIPVAVWATGSDIRKRRRHGGSRVRPQNTQKRRSRDLSKPGVARDCCSDNKRFAPVFFI